MPLPGKPAATRQRTSTITAVVRGFIIEWRRMWAGQWGRKPTCTADGGAGYSQLPGLLAVALVPPAQSARAQAEYNLADFFIIQRR